MGWGKRLNKQCRELLELDEQVAFLEEQILESINIIKRQCPSGCSSGVKLPDERMKQLLINHRLRQDRSINLAKSPNTCPPCLTILLYSISIILVLMTIYNFSYTRSA